LRHLNVYIVLLASISVFASCKESDGNKKQNILAEYKGKVLYRSDIPEDVWKQNQINDSSGLLKSILDKWLENQVLVYEAENALSEDQKNKEKLIEDYRNSLLIYEYQQKLIREQLDTAVTEEEIIAFYNSNTQAFQLKKNIVKIKYIKINKQKADLNKLKNLMQSGKEEDNNTLRTLAESEAENFYLDSNWLFLDDITKEIPLNENYNQQRFLSNNKFVNLEENNTLYLLYILDFRIKDAVSPIDFEKERIKDIIRYQRKLSFLKSSQKSLFEQAIKKGDVKYYLDK
jgi:hypothetical protein